MTFTPAAAAAIDGPHWLRSRRESAAERFAAMDLPTDSEEIWRYSRISALDLGSYAPVTARATANGKVQAPAVGAATEALLATTGPRAALVVVVDGRVVHHEIDPLLEARGLFVGDAIGLDEVEGAPLLEVDASSVDAFTELNGAFLNGIVVVRVPPGMVVDQPVVIVQRVETPGSATFPRTVVRCGENSQVTVVEHQGSADVVAFVDPLVDLDLAPASRLDYVNVQAFGPRVTQVGLQVSRVGRDATLRSTVVALGGDYARVRSDSRIDGKGGSAELSAVYFADGDRMHDFRTLQDHIAPATTSNLLFKGAVSGEARSVYSGLIRVGKEARGTSAFQTNRNLVLSKGASAESVPNLEILTDDVKCSHASAVGPVDEEQRFYLESRGIPPKVAERLIVLGFLGEILDRLPVPGLAADLKLAMAARLEHVDLTP